MLFRSQFLLTDRNLAAKTQTVSNQGGTVAGTLRLILYLALAMVLMVLDHRNGWIWRLRYATSVLVEPVYRLASLPASGMHTLSVAFADRKMLTEQNQRLREDLLLANAKLNRMAAVAEQNERLKQLLDTQHSLDLNVQLARMIDVDLGSYRHREQARSHRGFALITVPMWERA